MIFSNEIHRNKSVLNVVVGPQRTASTFLHSLLATSSSFHVPLVKEINYLLMKSQWVDHFNLWKEPEFLTKLLLNFNTLKEIRKLNTPYNQLKLNQLRSFNYSSKEYFNLFETPFPGFDISPSYSAINEASWKLINAEFELNVYVIIREPVSRSWSALNLYARNLYHKRSPDYLSGETLTSEKELNLVLNHISDFSKAVVLAEYSKIVPMLHRVFDANLRVLDYSEIINNPGEILKQLRLINGVMSPDAHERKDTSLGIKDSVGVSLNRNSSGIVQHPLWFSLWFEKNFPEELRFYSEFLNSSCRDEVSNVGL